MPDVNDLRNRIAEFLKKPRCADLNHDFTIATEYLNGPGIDNKLKQSTGGSTSYFLADHLGSTRGLTDATGNVTSSLTYDSFGNVVSGSASTRYTYTGRELDDDTGLIYYRARWYDPQQGRFVSEDPIGLVGGINLFAYVENNPVRFSDPSGLCPQDTEGNQPTVCERLAQDADRIANEWILRNPVHIRNRVSPQSSLKMFNQSFGYVTFGTYFSDGPLGFWGTWADSRQDVLGIRDYQGESGFHPSFRDTLESGSDQVHHFGAFFSAGLTGHRFASNDHRANDANQGNDGDVRLGDQSYRLGDYLKRNPTQLKNIGNLIRDTICSGQPVPK